MATTQLRESIAKLFDDAAVDLGRIWTRADAVAAAATALHDLLPALVDDFGVQAATLGAYWYNDVREARGVRGRFLADPADIPETGTHALVGWAAAEAVDYTSFQALVEGGTQRRIADFSRLTVTNSALADPQARGWKRVGNPRCDFCRMLIGRGAVYSEDTASFQSHDHCNCSAEPAWR